MDKRKILAGFIFVLAGQIVALAVFLLLDRNSFIVAFVASLIAFFVSYKKLNKTKRQDK